MRGISPGDYGRGGGRKQNTCLLSTRTNILSNVLPRSSIVGIIPYLWLRKLSRRDHNIFRYGLIIEIHNCISVGDDFYTFFHSISNQVITCCIHAIHTYIHAMFNLLCSKILQVTIAALKWFIIIRRGLSWHSNTMQIKGPCESS